MNLATPLIASNALVVAGLAYTVAKLRRYRRKFIMYKTHETFQPGPINAVEIADFDARFKVTETGPDPSSAIQSVPSYKVQGGIDDFETWIICNFAKTAGRIFEFGTCTGKTAYLLALNSPPETRVTTLTLGPEQAASYRAENADAAHDTNRALAESVFSRFFYTGTPQAAKIEQLLCDSKVFDETDYREQFDLIFIDGSHAKSYVENDTDKALRMVKPGGVILWHDYRGPLRTEGVFGTLNALSQKLPLVHIKGTCLVAYRRTPER
ncbi:MAG: class I SAM-dependent methyltransferase [Xanthobacteraceae bacterium]